jgi:hypothetical protein
MKRNFLIGGSVAAILLVVLVYFYGGSQVPSGQPPLRSLTAGNVAQIKHEFNQAKTDVRLLLLLSPT